MSETVGATDLGVGLTMAFGVLASLAAVGMALTVETQVVAAWFFAAAMVAGVLSVAAAHLYR